MTLMDKIRPKKAFGQNFLIDLNILTRIVEAVRIQPSDNVLEVGPGRGALTRLLAERAAHVAAVEVDRQLVQLLRLEFLSAGNVTIVEADILKTDLALLLAPLGSSPWKVAANLPYNISSQVMFAFLDQRELFSRLVLMLQKEVGDRLAAPPGCKDYGILSVLFRLHFDISKEFIVRPGSFYPVPKVDSIVLSFDALPSPRYEVGDEPFFRKVVKAAFSQRRKTLWNCLRSASLGLDEAALHEALTVSDIDGARRGETLSLEEFALLSRSLLARRKAAPS